MKTGCYYISKCMTKEALQNPYINRAPLTVCEVGIFSREICPTYFLRSHLSSSPMGIFLGDYGTLHSNSKKY